jgi:dihydrofolate synthase/folylpolyglutamate synthase
MNYKESVQYMYDALPMFHRQGKSAYKKDLTNIIALCELIGNPQHQIKCIHIAGTNGKGSVSHMMAAILQKHGFKTGLYVSPHYKDYRERIKIDGIYISKKFISGFISRNKKSFEIIKPSFFEMTVALAFSWFHWNKVDYAIIETGLGGRLDSTNIIHPLLSIITNISYDHSDILGDTLSKIAFEKAGIIKSHVPILIGRKQEETTTVFSDTAKDRNAELYNADDLIATYSSDSGENGISAIHTIYGNQQINFFPSLKGVYQHENIKTVLAACKILDDKSIINLNTSDIVGALEHTIELTNMMGRWQTISENPKIICESAHNEDGFHHLIRQINSMRYDNLHIVCGFVKDKPLDNVLSLMPENASYYFVKADIPRALDENELKELAAVHGLKGNMYSSVRNGLAAAKKAVEKDGLILVTGSIFVVAEVL